MNESVRDFQQIYADFRPKIISYLSRMVGEFEAEDLTQEVFLKVNQALPTFRGESQLSTWIYRIARNAALDRMRSPSFKHSMEAELPDEDEVQEILGQNALTDETGSLEQDVCHKEKVECYLGFVKKLPVNYRMIVALSELEDLAVNEIAGILGLNVDVVKIRLHRGRVKLLQALKSHCKAEDWL